MQSLSRLSDTGVINAGLSPVGLVVSLFLHFAAAGGLLAAGAWLDSSSHIPPGLAGPQVMAVTYVTMPSTPVMDLPQPESFKPERVQEKPPEQRKAREQVVKIAEDALRKVEKPEELESPHVSAPQPPAVQHMAVGTGGATTAGHGQGAILATDRAVLRQTYTDILMRHIAAHRHYPRSARKRRQQGTAIVQFVLDRAGKLVSLHLMESTGHRALDRAAMQTLRNAQPFPGPSQSLRDQELVFTLPVKFSLTN